MNAFFNQLVRRKILIPVLFGILMLASLAILPLTTINYDLAQYLPENAGTKKAIQVAKAEFDYPGTAEVMASGISLAEASALKKQLAAVPGVISVLWLDDVTASTKPTEFIPKETLEQYYKDGCALFHLEFTEGDYSEKTSAALTQIRTLDSRLSVAGNAENSRYMKAVLAGEMFQIISIVVPVCILILLLASFCWMEPFLYLMVIGVAISINMGTNAFFGSVSFITYSMAALLQMAVSMDYSIFLMHRYFEERDNGCDVRQAVVKAAASSLSTVAASALTTVAGFGALLFMQYGIGADIGLVLLKGIVISFITVMVLMPVLILLFSKVLDKTRHRPFMPSFRHIGKAAIKLRYGIILVAALLLVPTLLAQNKNQYLYGDSSASTGEGKSYEERKAIIDRFGINNVVMLLVPAGDTSAEIGLASELEALPHVQKVTALVTIADRAIAADFLPKAVRDSFVSAHYSRMIVYLNTDGETPESFEAVKAIRAASERRYPGKWLAAGLATSLADIKDTVTEDSKVVLALSLLAVGVIVLATFRSISIPILLLLVIELSVWFNMSIPYFTGFKMAYLGYLVISSLQLGATIDYGILLSTRYMEFRQLSSPKEAAVDAVRTAGPSILVSALILATAGFGFGMVSKVESISELGMLIGRGALTSGIMTILLLPSLLAVLDKLIYKTTMVKRNGVKA